MDRKMGTLHLLDHRESNVPNEDMIGHQQFSKLYIRVQDISSRQGSTPHSLTSRRTSHSLESLDNVLIYVQTSPLSIHGDTKYAAPTFSRSVGPGVTIPRNGSRLKCRKFFHMSASLQKSFLWAIVSGHARHETQSWNSPSPA